jgi:hypothetical protein
LREETNMKTPVKDLMVGSMLMAAVGLAGCQAKDAHGMDAEVADVVADVATGRMEEATEAKEASGFVEREFWLALAEEPGWHLEQARDLYLAGDTRLASEELNKVAALLNFESRHSKSDEARRRLLASVEELREVASVVRLEGTSEGQEVKTAPVDRVEARTFRALGVHHLALARQSLETGDALMASKYTVESANDVELGFARAGEDPGRVMLGDLADARALAERLEKDGDGGRLEVTAALDRLEDALNGLGEVLGSRRK